MALIIEDGTGLETSNSYADRTFADAYFEEHLYYSETWGAYTTVQKDNALMSASAFLDQTYDWHGTKKVEASAMRWPREGVYSIDDISISSSIIPVNLKRAACELAVELLQGDRLAASDSTGIEELTVGPIELKFDKEVKPVLTARVHTLLRGLGTSILGARTVKVYRS